MTTFYDPQKRKTKEWVFAAFILIPIIVTALIYLVAKNIAENKKAQQQKETSVDIFNK